MFSLPALRDEGILEGFRLHRERTRGVRPTLPAKSIPVPSSCDFCALCVSALSSPNVDALDAASSISPLSATLTKNTRGWVSVPIVNPISQFNRRFISNSHRITSFAHPYPLTPIESYSCKKQGEWSPLPQAGGEGPHICTQHTGIPVYPEPGRGATSIASYAYFITCGHPGVGGFYSLLTTRHSLSIP